MPRGRPRGTTKYKSDQQRRSAKRASIAPRLTGRYFRLVVPDLRQYTSPQALLRLKGDTLNLLLDRQGQALQYYKVAVQTHPTTGVPHLDILLLYRRSVQKSLNRFDYLVKHGDLTRYRRLNQAILSYGDKQDPNPLTNMPRAVSLVLRAKEVELDPYQVLRTQMLRDPFHFDALGWIRANNLDGAFSRTNWSKAISLVRHMQQAECNRILHDKPGFGLIDRDLILRVLTDRQYRIYTRNCTIFSKIVQKLNEIVRYGCHRPFKTRQLLLVSPPDCGKTSLALRVKRFVSVYHMGVRNWFPAYRSDVYRMILWDEFNLRAMPYPDLLKFLQGLQMDLQYKGGSTLRTDNQLILMTSNLTLTEHIQSRFRAPESRAHAQANLRARIEQVILPPGVDLFLLQKLIVPL